MVYLAGIHAGFIVHKKRSNLMHFLLDNNVPLPYTCLPTTITTILCDSLVLSLLFAVCSGSVPIPENATRSRTTGKVFPPHLNHKKGI